jgi:hypothetical protein
MESPRGADPSDLGGRDAHNGGSGMGIPASGHVAASALDRKHPLPQADPRRRFDLELLKAFLLGQGEAAHLVVGKLYVVLDLLRNLIDQAGPLLVAQQEVPSPTVELLRVCPHGGFAACLDVDDHGLDDFAGFPVLFHRGEFRLLKLIHVRLRDLNGPISEPALLSGKFDVLWASVRALQSRSGPCDPSSVLRAAEDI